MILAAGRQAAMRAGDCGIARFAEVAALKDDGTLAGSRPAPP